MLRYCLCVQVGALKLAGPRCSGARQRSIIYPEGNHGYKFIATGNLLGIRTVLLALLAASRGVRFLIEQPEGSAFELLPRGAMQTGSGVGGH